MAQIHSADINLILAAEDFTPEEFVRNHHFLGYEENIIRQLMAHGPVLLKGGRGTGKSALLREANRRLNEDNTGSQACGIYLSLRHLPLLRTSGKQYEHELLTILIDKVSEVAFQYEFAFNSEPEVYHVHKELVRFSEYINKRVVLFFDDAAHIGREAALEEFFDLFRTLSSSQVSCKAAIYPGVTRFGNRFDIYNDATVIEISRREEQEDFRSFFTKIMSTRFPNEVSLRKFSKELPVEEIASFIGQAVVGNVRSFVKACSTLFKLNSTSIGFQTLSEALLEVSRDYYWPMLEEIKLKIGVYEALIEPSEHLANLIYTDCGKKTATSCIVHRTLVAKLDKSIEILEYTGFLARREASRAMKSGGRGTRFVLNLCNLLEVMPGSRLTKEIFDIWRERKVEDVQFSNLGALASIEWPELPEDKSLRILELPIENLKKSNIFPYGITDNKLEILKANGYNTVGDLANESDENLLKIDQIGRKTVDRFRSVLGQAIWM